METEELQYSTDIKTSVCILKKEVKCKFSGFQGAPPGSIPAPAHPTAVLLHFTAFSQRRHPAANSGFLLRSQVGRMTRDFGTKGPWRLLRAGLGLTYTSQLETVLETQGFQPPVIHPGLLSQGLVICAGQTSP